MFGLHPNTEIEYLTITNDNLFANIMMIQGGSSGVSGKKQEDVVKEYIDKFLKELPENFNMIEIGLSFGTNITPYEIVWIQECERMNFLLGEIRKSLNDLDAGFNSILLKQWSSWGTHYSWIKFLIHGLQKHISLRSLLLTGLWIYYRESIKFLYGLKRKKSRYLCRFQVYSIQYLS